jgi:hypothetical protein
MLHTDEPSDILKNAAGQRQAMQSGGKPRLAEAETVC